MYIDGRAGNYINLTIKCFFAILKFCSAIKISFGKLVMQLVYVVESSPVGLSSHPYHPHKLKYVRHATWCYKLHVTSLPVAYMAAKRLHFVCKSMAMMLFFEIRALFKYMYTVLSI